MPRPRPQDTAQDADNRAKVDMDTTNNVFNNAVLRLQDVVTLCSQPQPPADCSSKLKEAEQNVKGKQLDSTRRARLSHLIRSRCERRRSNQHDVRSGEGCVQHR